MLATLFLPDAAVLRLDHIAVEDHQLTLTVRTTAAEAPCPTCAQPTRRVHSRYIRTVTDLPCAALPIRWQLHSRRFLCTNAACPRRTFAERLPTVVAPAARRTLRQTAHLQQTGLHAGGEVGAHLLQASGIPVSPDTVLRAIRRTPLPSFPTPRVLGVDDWARCKGQTYGTILCDLESATRWTCSPIARLRPSRRGCGRIRGSTSSVGIAAGPMLKAHASGHPRRAKWRIAGICYIISVPPWRIY